jgi:hypothetical protein
MIMATGVMSAVGVLAGYIPARVDPLVALRYN